MKLKWTMLLLCFASFQMVVAQSKIGYIDSQEIRSKYADMVDAQKKLDAENAKWGQELEKMNSDLEEFKFSLERDRLTLTPELWTERKLEQAKQEADIQKYQNAKWGEQGDYFKKLEEYLQPILDKINKVVQRIAEEEEYDYVFDVVEGNVVYAKETYNLTDQVLEELEKETSTENQNERRSD